MAAMRLKNKEVDRKAEVRRLLAYCVEWHMRISQCCVFSQMSACLTFMISSGRLRRRTARCSNLQQQPPPLLPPRSRSHPRSASVLPTCSSGWTRSGASWRLRRRRSGRSESGRRRSVALSLRHLWWLPRPDPLLGLFSCEVVTDSCTYPQMQRLINEERARTAAAKLSRASSRAWDAGKLSSLPGTPPPATSYPSVEVAAREARRAAQERARGPERPVSEAEAERIRKRDGVLNDEVGWESVVHHEGTGRAQTVVSGAEKS